MLAVATREEKLKSKNASPWQEKYQPDDFIQFKKGRQKGTGEIPFSEIQLSG